ncbi:aflatoxin biosynthesis ketoreductase nor-1 [Roridomyces roridus]|uniref:Aflatoxin biosynthesis ketoreductase nor-1 n=1 Tax=Roridomyces roridus TaxID=1738132 RepID=A0AAD7CDY9_9AGAR|nr:aflatoxin biosynthesis ketoreductase nor-1 [Roridomyces roridus]
MVIQPPLTLVQSLVPTAELAWALSALASRPNTIVFAGARDPAAQSLRDLSAKHYNVHGVKLTLGDKSDNEAAAAEIKRIAGQLDVIIANAGISKYYGPLAETPISEFRDHWETNTLGNVILFQATHALLLASPSKAPRFAMITSSAASMGSYSVLAHAVMDQEHPSLISLAIHPGWVQTEMGNQGALANGMAEAPETVEDSVNGTLARVDQATSKELSGKFWTFKVSHEGMLWNVATDEIHW